MQQHNIQEINSTGKVPWRLFILLFMFATLGQLAVDLYLPSLPAISRAFEASHATVQMTIAVFLLGVGASQLFYGPWSDAVGRRRPLLTGVGLTVLGSILCCVAPNIHILILGRLLQGLGAGACNSVGRSLIRDLVSGHYLSRLGGQMGMASSFMVAVAPAIGGYIQHYTSWRVSFVVIFIYASIVLALLWHSLPETHKKPDPQAIHFKRLVHNYGQLLASPVFLGNAFCAAIAYSGIIAYITASPFLLQTTLKISPVQFGWLALLNATGIFTSGMINSHCVVRYGIPKMLFSGILAMSLGAGIMLGIGCFGVLNVVVIVLPMALFCMGAGLTFQNASAGALESFGHIAGSAGAIYGTLQISSGALVSAFMSLLHEKTQLPLAATQVGLALLAMIAWRVAQRAERRSK
ncbi:MAG: emrD [Gammaproteobacteria bacterium]|jgi:Bcr/CflA subfamily drug resistance transporter|nr:emrD [Gammaproteobacteria bacterium]